MSEQQSNLVKIAGLWSAKDRNGRPYLSGTSNGVTWTVFKNTFKEEGKNQPDYNLYVAAAKKKDDPKKDVPPEDEIPF